MIMSVWLSPQKNPPFADCFKIPFNVIEANTYTYIYIIGKLDFTQLQTNILHT